MASSAAGCGPANCHSRSAFRSGDAPNGWVPQRIDGCSLVYPPALPMPPTDPGLHSSLVQDTDTTAPSPRLGSLHVLPKPAVQTEQLLQASIVPPTAPPSMLRQMATACRNRRRPEPQPLSTSTSAVRNDVQLDANSVGVTTREDAVGEVSFAISPLNVERQSAPAPPPSPVFGVGHGAEIDLHEPEIVEEATSRKCSPRTHLAPPSPPPPSAIPVPQRLTQQDNSCGWPEDDCSSASVGLCQCKQQVAQSVLRPRCHNPRERLVGYRQHAPMAQPVPPKGFEGELVCLQCSLPASNCQRRRQHLSSWQPIGQGSWPLAEILKPVLSTRKHTTTSSGSKLHSCSTVSRSRLPRSARGNSSDSRLQSARRARSPEVHDGLPRLARTQSSSQTALQASNSTQSLSASTRSLGAASTTSLTSSVTSFKCLTARGARGAGHVAGGLPRSVR